MFGINEISWSSFFETMIIFLIVWYVLVIVLAWIKTHNQSTVLFEEKTQGDHHGLSSVHPVHVLSGNFPDKILSPLGVNSVPLEVSVYEESWPEDGYQLEYLLEEKDGKLLKQLLPVIQYQQ